MFWCCLVSSSSSSSSSSSLSARVAIANKVGPTEWESLSNPWLVNLMFVLGVTDNDCIPSLDTPSGCYVQPNTHLPLESWILGHLEALYQIYIDDPMIHPILLRTPCGIKLLASPVTYLQFAPQKIRKCSSKALHAMETPLWGLLMASSFPRTECCTRWHLSLTASITWRIFPNSPFKIIQTCSNSTISTQQISISVCRLGSPIVACQDLYSVPFDRAEDRALTDLDLTGATAQKPEAFTKAFRGETGCDTSTVTSSDKKSPKRLMSMGCSDEW